MTIDAYILVGIAIALAGLYLAGMLWTQASARRETHRRVQRAIRNILEDGVVEGPKGRYVPHRKWDVGMARGTGNTGMGGYYGSA